MEIVILEVQLNGYTGLEEKRIVIDNESALDRMLDISERLNQ